MKKLNLTTILGTVFVLLLMLAVIVFIYAWGFAGASAENTEAIESAKSQEIYNFLVLGKDAAAGLCDVVMIVSIDTSSGDVNIMQIPRDTYFNYTDGTYKKINGAPKALGTSAFATALGDALGISIDYYLALSLDTVAEMVDFVDGVEIDVPSDMDYDDPAQDLSIHLKAGRQLLDGKNALGFLRYRSGYVTGDLARIDAQKLFLNSFVKRIGEQKNPMKYISIFKLICSKGETNIKESDLFLIGMKCSQTKGGEVCYMTLPGDAVQSEKSGAWYYILSRSAASQMLEERYGLFRDKKDFDKEEKFVDKNTKSFYDIYNKHCEYRVYTANDIENNRININ